MSTFQFSSQQPLDLHNLTIPGEWVKLVSLTMDYAQVIFTEFTPEVTRFMFPKPPDKIEETQEFIGRSLENMQTAKDLIVVIQHRQPEHS